MSVHTQVHYLDKILILDLLQKDNINQSTTVKILSLLDGKRVYSLSDWRSYKVRGSVTDFPIAIRNFLNEKEAFFQAYPPQERDLNGVVLLGVSRWLVYLSVQPATGQTPPVPVNYDGCEDVEKFMEVKQKYENDLRDFSYKLRDEMPKPEKPKTLPPKEAAEFDQDLREFDKCWKEKRICLSEFTVANMNEAKEYQGCGYGQSMPIMLQCMVMIPTHSSMDDKGMQDYFQKVFFDPNELVQDAVFSKDLKIVFKPLNANVPFVAKKFNATECAKKAAKSGLSFLSDLFGALGKGVNTVSSGL